MKKEIKFIDPLGKVLLQMELKKFPIKLGRSSENEIVLNHPSISRVHCLIEKRGNDIVLVDNGSVNGIKVSGQKVSQVVLSKNSNFKLGELVGLIEEEVQNQAIELSDGLPSEEKTQVPRNTEGYVANTRKIDAEFEFASSDVPSEKEENTASFVMNSSAQAEEDIFSAKTVIRPSVKLKPAPGGARKVSSEIAASQAGPAPVEIPKPKGPSPLLVALEKIKNSLSSMNFKIQILSGSTRKSLAFLGLAGFVAFAMWYLSNHSLSLGSPSAVTADELRTLVQETISKTQSSSL